VRPHSVRRPRLALGDGAATRVGFFGTHRHSLLGRHELVEEAEQWAKQFSLCETPHGLKCGGGGGGIGGGNRDGRAIDTMG